MNVNLPAVSIAPAALPESRPLELPLDPQLLTKVLTCIRADSQSEADEYLRETVVPHGGE